MHCFDCSQTQSIVALLINQGEPVLKWTTLSKKIGSGPKNVKKWFFFRFSQFTALKQLAILFCCSDYAQTYRIVGQSILEGGKTKIKRKTVVISYLPLQKFQGSAGVDFGSVKF